jgi:hypothetical protein
MVGDYGGDPAQRGGRRVAEHDVEYDVQHAIDYA